MILENGCLGLYILVMWDPKLRVGHTFFLIFSFLWRKRASQGGMARWRYMSTC